MGFVRVEYGDSGLEKWINLDLVVEVNVTPARAAGWDEEFAEKIYPSPLGVEVVYLAPSSRYEDGGDYPERARVEVRPYTANLYGDEAAKFLERAGDKINAEVR